VRTTNPRGRSSLFAGHPGSASPLYLPWNTLPPAFACLRPCARHQPPAPVISQGRALPVVLQLLPSPHHTRRSGGQCALSQGLWWSRQAPCPAQARCAMVGSRLPQPGQALTHRWCHLPLPAQGPQRVALSHLYPVAARNRKAGGLSGQTHTIRPFPAYRLGQSRSHDAGA